MVHGRILEHHRFVVFAAVAAAAVVAAGEEMQTIKRDVHHRRCGLRLVE